MHVTTDSRHVHNGITQWIYGWIKNDLKTSNQQSVKNIELWKRLHQAAQFHTVHWHKVNSHRGHVENEIADKLANQAVSKLLD